MSFKALAFASALSTSLLGFTLAGSAQASTATWSADEIGPAFEQNLDVTSSGTTRDLPIALTHVSRNGNGWSFKVFSDTVPADTVIYAFGTGSAAQQLESVTIGGNVIHSPREDRFGIRDGCVESGNCQAANNGEGGSDHGSTRFRVVFTYPVTNVTLSDTFSRYGQQNAPSPPTAPIQDGGSNGGNDYNYNYSYDTGNGDTSLPDYNTGDTGNPGDYTPGPQISHTAPFTPGAPEPAAWLLMITAVGGMGAALRCARRQRAAAAAA